MGDEIIRPPSVQEVKRALDKILSSRLFQSAERQREFLRYAVEQHLEGRADRIKEYSIGTEVFGRGDSFDPRLDPIVRIEARKLRQRLAKYYDAEGEHDHLRIEFPKGGYCPVFQRRLVPAPASLGPSIVSPPRGRIVQWKLAVTALAVLILAAASGYMLGAGRRATAVSNRATAIAVLPFLNLGESREDDYFSDGLTEELIDSLGRVPGLQVVARTSSFQFRGKTGDIREIGQTLNARTVLEGSVRKYGGRLRITAQLADTANGYRLWSESYDRETKDALAIQRDISQAIVRALTGRLGDTSLATHASLVPLDGPIMVSPEAHEAYLKGLYFWNKNTPDSNHTAQAYLQEAIAKEPGYARAYTALARCYIMLPYLTGVPPRAMISKVESAAEKALRLDGSLAEAHVDRAVAAAWDYDWAASQREFQKGLELDPDASVAHWLYNEDYLVEVGQLEESLSEAQAALRLEPVSAYLTQDIGRSLYFLRRYSEAIEQFRKAQALDANVWFTNRGLGLVYLKDGMYAEGVRELETADRLSNGDPWTSGLLGYAYGISGNRAAAQKILGDFLQRSNRGPFPAVAVAQVYLGLGNKSKAFEWLWRGVDQGDAHILLLAEPLYDSIRADPRFPELLQRMKVPVKVHQH